MKKKKLEQNFENKKLNKNRIVFHILKYVFGSRFRNQSKHAFGSRFIN